MKSPFCGLFSHSLTIKGRWKSLAASPTCVLLEQVQQGNGEHYCEYTGEHENEER